MSRPSIKTFAAVMTGKGTGAISTVQLFGDAAESILKKIFVAVGSKPATFRSGKILLGEITDASQAIDQVTIGCEGANSFAINCHGNPLIVADIMKLLRQQGARPLTAEQLLYKILSECKSLNTIAVEARLAQTRARTIEGTQIIANQAASGLSKEAAQWLTNLNAAPLEKIASSAEHILQSSRTAGLIIYGCTAVIAGPPNTGKSTLLNRLCGKQKAIVTDIKGTTRDWVSAECRTDSLSIEFIDTAGLDEELSTSEDDIEKASQQKATEVLENTDLVLLVLDNSQTIEQLDPRLLGKIAGKKVLTILNKSDLPARLDTAELPQSLAETVQISAKLGTGIETLLRKIRQTLGVADFNIRSPVAFTTRQQNLLKQLAEAESKDQAALALTELLNGPIRV